MAPSGWLCAGPRWSADGPALLWLHPEHGERRSPLPAGRALGFVTGDRRYCVGVRRAGRYTPCPAGAEVPAGAVSGQCAECARLDRSRSVAADTMADDPRPYDVYLAWFAPGLVKAGITATERQGVRLLEQAALSYALLGRGPLMAARRTEAVLGAALGVPDRFPYAAKRAARHPLVLRAERAAELAALHARARALPGLPESLDVAAFVPVHHDDVFHLDRVGPRHGVVDLAPGSAVVGHVVAVAGPDVYLETADGRQVLVDTRRLAGWQLAAAPAGARTTAAVRAPEPERDGPEGLF
ncbi:DUF2797 domain-containing protein [Streptomyces mobaraensis NBRC 13819 = DSM 40847]|uniref:DUF2797 domain-containing protein n=1 Tax=Streptomyces mobaraensis (strain ATCC 29032 / DSM 40847 / JCM 4168 / NBRC 13819 / NCIMB 11159 / IPCR 16-22) TaxID=1223523 RepID=M3CDN8_STRM1|nr:DUF2797 domain-containing protein [Streptomyces mobaraensis]EMF02187.1 hypothetical protein H340_01764 [Streptomyces mobaraensis NBRC 13819 = DSM 40847]QTT72649.1 DUF2797 domain-containing protein [Streptomyces mobaraensis NBRC 13819 = DSM 40847]